MRNMHGPGPCPNLRPATNLLGYGERKEDGWSEDSDRRQKYVTLTYTKTSEDYPIRPF